MNVSDFLPIFIDEACEILEHWEQACISLEKKSDPDTINALFRAAHNLKGSSRSVGLTSFGAFVHIIEDLITKIKANEVALDSAVIGLILDCQAALVQWVECLRSDPTTEIDIGELAQKLKHMQGSRPDAQATSAGFGIFEDEPVPAVAVAVAPPAEQQASAHKADETIRISLRKMDNLIRLIGELSIQQSIVKNANEHEDLNTSQVAAAINLATKVLQDLQSEAMSLRMQPLENLFQRMERVCSDVARQQSKALNVVLAGTDVELDKTVIERMKDPLVHILRNAVDHGIESPDERVKLGKPRAATVSIAGMQMASSVAIRITDDGRGLNLDRILKKAVEKGLVSAEAKPSKEQIVQMIFLPGFSTAEKVTDVSGRGVGMDVVRRGVEELGGSIIIETEVGQGTQISISLPSTLSIIDAVVVELSKQLYAIPIQDVEEVIDMTSLRPETTMQKGRVVNLRGTVLPLESLQTYLPGAERDGLPAAAIALVTRHQNTSVAFEVDRIVGQQSIVVRQLEDNLAEVPGFSGATILSNGEPSMIIHLPQVVKSFIATLK